VQTIPKQIWFLQENDGLQHLLELNFKNRLKNVELKLNEELIFDLKLKDHKTTYPFRIGDRSYTLILRKIPVGGYECEVVDDEAKKLPCKIDRPRNFGKPRRHWNKIVPLVGYLIACSWILLIIILTYKIFIQH